MSDKKFYKYCQSCGSEQVYKEKSSLQRAIKRNTICYSCSNKLANQKGVYREIPISWLEEKKRKAISRGREFSIDIEYIWKIYLRQNRMCALSGLPLDFNKDSAISMVSIDRINNEKGYVKRNIQLVDKRINYMKYTYPQKEFLELCRLVAEFKKFDSE